MNTTPAKPSHAPRWSLRIKLTLWFVVISTVIQVTLVLLAVFYFRITLSGFFDERLMARSRLIADAVRRADCKVSDEDLTFIAQDGPRFIVVEPLVLTLYDHDGDAISSNLRPAPSASEMGVPGNLEVTSARTSRRMVPGLVTASTAYEARVVMYPIRAGNGRMCVLTVAATDTFFHEMMSISTQVVLITLTAGTLACAVAGWMISGLAIAPLERLRRITVSLAPDALQDPAVGNVGEFREAAELERSLDETRAKLRLAFQSQDRFLANVSHELKTPIAVVLAEADTLPSTDLTPASLAFIQSTKEEMLRLGKIVESFLTLTKLRSGAAILHPTPVNMNSIVLEATVECRKEAQLRRVALVPELAETDHDLHLLGDADQLQVMIANLVRNAIRFSPEGREIIVRVIDLETECAVTIRDFGPGVPPEILDKLFDRFVQGPNESSRGHGLGLAIAQGVAELHGGSIKVRNVPEGGCEFSIRLPLAPRNDG